MPLLLGLLLLLAWWFKDLWWPKEEATVKNDPVTVSEPQTKNLKKPKEKELRKLKDVLYRYLNGRWVDGKGVAVTDPSVLNQLGDAPVVGEGNMQGEGLNTPLTETDAAKADESKNDKADDAKAEQNKDENKQQPPVDPLAEDKSDTKEDQNKVDEKTQQPPVDPLAENKSDTQAGQNKEDDKKNQTTSNANAKPLQIPTTSTQNGNVDFLNGQWNAGAGIQDKTTGKPLRLKYAFSGGVGQVQVQRGDGVQCTGDVSAKMQGSGLNITNKGVAKCSDGSSYQLPEVICKPGAKSIADCQGGYGSGQSFPMTMKSN